MLIIAGLMVLVPVPVGAAESVDQAVKKILGDKSIQSNLPGKAKAQGPLFGPGGRSGASSWRGFGAIGEVILWGMIVFIAGALIYFLIREAAAFWRRPRRARGLKSSADGAGTIPAEPALPADLLAEADRLAARGDFAEAVHLILIHSLRWLEAGGSAVLGVSLTAREIIARSGLQNKARSWFSQIVEASERVHFGGRDADAPAYAQVRDAFESLAGEIAGPAAQEAPA